MPGAINGCSTRVCLLPTVAIGPSPICGSFSWVDSWGGQTLRGGQPPPPMMMRCSSSHPQLLPPGPVVIERTLRASSPSLVSSPTAKPLASQPPQRPPDPPTPACPPRAARGCGGRFLAAVLGLAALKVPRGGGKFKHSRRAAVAAAQPPCPAWRRLLGRLQLTCGGRCATCAGGRRVRSAALVVPSALRAGRGDGDGCSGGQGRARWPHGALLWAWLEQLGQLRAPCAQPDRVLAGAGRRVADARQTMRPGARL